MNTSFESANDCFALLDDCDASADNPRSRLLTGFVEALVCDEASGLPAMLARMEASLRRGLHAVGVFSYELGADMHSIAPHLKQGPPAQVLLFERCERLSSAQVLEWLNARKQDRPAGIADVHASVTDGQFEGVRLQFNVSN